MDKDAGEGISIHAPRVGSDLRPAWGFSSPNISIHAPRVGSDLDTDQDNQYDRYISIHAPRVGSDLILAWSLQLGKSDFNPRSPCGERPGAGVSLADAVQFQSTLPVWGATTTSSARSTPSPNFNPRSPCGERPF